jgi:hypothetical protein
VGYGQKRPVARLLLMRQVSYIDPNREEPEHHARAPFAVEL